MPLRKLFQGAITTSFCAVTTLALFGAHAACAQAIPDTSKMPWMNKSLPPDQRADLVLEQMTLDEKIQMVHGAGWGFCERELQCLRNRTLARDLWRVSTG